MVSLEVFAARNSRIQNGISSILMLFATCKPTRFRISSSLIALENNSVIGLSDGLTVPFALAAGLSSLGESRLVVLGGVAELIAGAISMGIGGFRRFTSKLSQYEKDANRRFGQSHLRRNVIIIAT
jgi:hypothetical protein